MTEKFKPYVNDYKINLFEIAYLTDAQIKLFKIVVDYFVQMRRNSDYKPKPQSESADGETSGKKSGS